MGNAASQGVAKQTSRLTSAFWQKKGSCGPVRLDPSGRASASYEMSALNLHLHYIRED